MSFFLYFIVVSYVLVKSVRLIRGTTKDIVLSKADSFFDELRQSNIYIALILLSGYFSYLPIEQDVASWFPPVVLVILLSHFYYSNRPFGVRVNYQAIDFENVKPDIEAEKNRRSKLTNGSWEIYFEISCGSGVDPLKLVFDLPPSYEVNLIDKPDNSQLENKTYTEYNPHFESYTLGLLVRPDNSPSRTETISIKDDSGNILEYVYLTN
jgi:hypothetical protein